MVGNPTLCVPAHMSRVSRLVNVISWKPVPVAFHGIFWHRLSSTVRGKHLGPLHANREFCANFYFALLPFPSDQLLRNHFPTTNNSTASVVLTFGFLGFPLLPLGRWRRGVGTELVQFWFGQFWFAIQLGVKSWVLGNWKFQIFPDER